MHKRGLSGALGAAVVFLFSACAEKEKTAALDLALAAERAFASFEAEDDTRKIRDTARDALSGFAARDLYDAIEPLDPARAARGVALDLRRTGKGKLLTHEFLAPSRGVFAIAAPPTFGPGPEIGDAVLLFALLPLERPEGALRLNVTSGIRTGRGDAFAILRAAGPMLNALENAAQKAKPGDDPLLDLIRRELPETSAFLLDFFAIEGRTVWSADEKRLEMRPRLRLRSNRLEEEHPELAAWVERVGEAVESRAKLATTDGGSIIEWRWDGFEEGLTASLDARDGRLLPLVTSGEEDATTAVDFEMPRKLTLTSGGSIELYGLKTTVDGIIAAIDLDPRAKAPGLRLAVAGLPRIVKVEGSLFGIVPPGLLDLLVPGTLETSAMRAMETTLLGRNGDGVLLVASADGDKRSRVSSTILMADVPGGTLTRLARRWLASATRPSEDEWADLRRFAETMAGHLRTDLAGSS